MRRSERQLEMTGVLPRVPAPGEHSDLGSDQLTSPVSVPPLDARGKYRDDPIETRGTQGTST